MFLSTDLYEYTTLKYNEYDLSLDFVFLAVCSDIAGYETICRDMKDRKVHHDLQNMTEQTRRGHRTSQDMTVHDPTSYNSTWNFITLCDVTGHDGTQHNT